MGADLIDTKTVFRHGTFNSHPRLTTCIFLSLWTILFVAALSARSWIGVIGVSALAGLLYASLAYAKFEIWESGFSHRDLWGTHVLKFSEIDDALLESVNYGDGNATVFSLRLKGEVRRHKVPIGRFGVQADALLFTALERYGIIIGQDGSRLVESSIQRIREAQSAEGDMAVVDGTKPRNRKGREVRKENR